MLCVYAVRRVFYSKNKNGDKYAKYNAMVRGSINILYFIEVNREEIQSWQRITRCI
jgi:spore cortex formation protein SpoVR/YcgB (stage V sporulation)